MADHPLFRPEVFEASVARSLGTIRLARPWSHRAAALTALLIVASIAAFAVFGSYTRRANVPGFLEPTGGALRLTTSTGGTVALVRAVEGQAVRAGDVVATLAADRWSTRGDTDGSIAVQLAQRAASLDRERRLVDARDVLRTRTTTERLAAIDGEVAELARETAINGARQRIATENVERFDALARTGFVAPSQAQARVDDLLVLQAGGAGYARLQTNLARERVGLVGQLAESRLQAAAEHADLERQRALLAQEQAEADGRRASVVVAPRDGTITGIAVRTGQRVGPGIVIATLIPDQAPLEALLFASSRQAGFVATGQSVHLRYAAYPYQKFGMGDGVVASIEQAPYAPQELPPQVAAALGVASGTEPVYRIVVRLDRQTIRTYGHDQPLKAGMAFDADIVQDRRRLVEWWLEPLYGLAER